MLRGALVGALCGLAAWALARREFFVGIEEWCQDLCFDARGTRHTSTKILIIGLDDASLRELPKPLAALSPELAEVVTWLDRRGAKAIALDVMIPETLDEYDRKPGLGGKALGLAAYRSGKVVMPMLGGDQGRPLRPLASWIGGAAGMGFLEVDEDDDHIVRQQELFKLVDNERQDQLGLALLRVAKLAEVDERRGALYVEHEKVPLDHDHRVRINFVGRAGTVPYLSFRDALGAARGRSGALLDQHKRAVDPKDALVILGASALSLGDYHATPYSNGTLPPIRGRANRQLMSGPELQANIVATLADGAAITTPRWLDPLPWVLVVSALLGAAFMRLSVWEGFAVVFVHHWAWKAACVAAFWYAHWRLEMVAMLLAGPTCLAAVSILRGRRLRTRMGDVVKGDILARLLEAEADHPELAGEERTISVLFADIRGFTAWSREHTPREVVALLNAYFEAVIPIVERRGGLVDKYIGDGVMAIFGAPEPKADHAAQAVTAAAEIVQAVRRRSREWTSLDFEDLRIGVGVHTGSAVVGMIGSRQRLDYTAIGDAVNTAARIESANKELGAEVLISPRARRAVGDERLLQSLGCSAEPLRAAAHGIAEGLELYRLEPPAG
jgi:adenylate cyclase